ncbi:mandelate racemase/muconate lactonizing enzyme family protein [Paenibacillus ehimensis]|uniref:Mandelate racemase/muconate lactonizing enzyme family protein n=1 Tax=Paenibacillus ehimensis TaxID=79264 RepID=A0ABT8V362_9BACL|nr:mandelate racemase/muconate lactonizing enzyme family protein [Paenibacillus ehimensis]MDO3675868.1 mandelate racemase/muconate lactonizing enzyme family protein [Paenibacillus ehimensis]
MFIKDVITTPVLIPFKKPAKWSGGTRKNAPALIVQLITDEGVIGYGECVGPTISTIQTIVEKEFKPFLIGKDPMQTELILHQLEEYILNWSQIGYYALAGIDIALLDLKAKLLNTPVYNLLGGLYRKEVSFSGYLFIDDPLVNAKEAEEIVAQGYDEIKIKVGRDIDLDTRRIQEIRRAVGPKVKLRIDANQIWSVSSAIKAINRMAEYDLQLVEQPIPYYDIDGLATVSQSVPVPITADESCTTFDTALRLIEKRAVAAFTVYPSEAGGLLKAKQIVELANSCGIWCVTGSWAETGIATLANAHLIAASRNFPFANDTHYGWYTSDVLKNPLSFRNGKLALSDSPGLGVELAPDFNGLAKEEIREMVFYDDESAENYQPRIGMLL